MADNTRVTAGTGDVVRDVDKGGVKTQVVALDMGGAGAEVLLDAAHPLPTIDGSDGAAAPVIAGTGARGWLRAIYEKLLAGVGVTGPLTDTELRAAAVPVSGPVTDAQLRAAAVPVSAAALPLPAGAATSAKQDAAKAVLDEIATDTDALANLDLALTALRDALRGANTGTLEALRLLLAGTLTVDTTDRAGRLVGKVTLDDGGDTTLGAKADAEVAGAGAASLIAIQKRLRTLLNGGLPGALVGGRLDVNVGASAGIDVTDRAGRAVGKVTSDDGGQATIGTTTDAEVAAGNGSLVALLKRLRTLLNGGLPAALVGGRLDVNVGASTGVDITDRAGRLNGKVTVDDGGQATIGALADAEVAGAGAASLIAITKRLRTLLSGGLPAALATNGGLKVEQNPSGYTEPAGSANYPTLGAAGTFFTIDTAAAGRWVSIQLLANASANTVTWESTNDPAQTTGWRAFRLTEIGDTPTNNSPSVSTTSVTVGATFEGRVPGRFVRVRVSNYVAGSITIAVEFHATPAVSHMMSVDTELPSPAALADAVANPTVPGVQAFPMLWSTATWARMRDAAAGDGLGQGTIAATMMGFVGNGNVDRFRIPNVFKGGNALTSTAVLWTPGSGKKFRVMRYKVLVSADAALAAAGVTTISLRDGGGGGTAFAQFHGLWLPAASAGTKPSDNYDSGWIDLGNGYLSSTANNTLAVNITTALTAGQVIVLCCGTEE